MKKLIILPLLAIFLMGGSAFAQSTSGDVQGSAEVNLPDPGITPDSAFYFVDSFFDAMKVFFAFSAEAKANAYLDIAAEKTAEAKAMAEQESEEAFEKARAKYETNIEKAEAKMEEIKAKNETRAEVVAERIATVTQTHVDVLVRVSANLPEAASGGINTAIEASREARQRTVDRLNNLLDGVNLSPDMEGSAEGEVESESPDEGTETTMEGEAEGEASMESDGGTSVEVEGEAGVEVTTESEEESSEETSEESGSEGDTGTVENVVVTYTDSGYSPAIVNIKAGSTVTFMNESSRGMWTASDVHPTHTLYEGTALNTHCPDSDNSSFDSCESISSGGSWSFTFEKSGSWDYHNHVRANHGGTVVVE
ncbi:MAG: DUF5667 domain-containing protein [Candidatus Spechtbacterales bacterium]|nr:DUF5667 domain-containing protein [Candidatus Spechtbacterales bacterium]